MRIISGELITAAATMIDLEIVSECSTFVYAILFNPLQNYKITENPENPKNVCIDDG